MKHFKIIGPKTTREFDIDDNQMIMWNVIEKSEYDQKKVVTGFLDISLPEQNVKIYPTKKSIWAKYHPPFRKEKQS